MSPLTLYLGRFFGLFVLLTCAALAARPKAAIAAMNDMVESPGLMLVTGIVTLAAGVACVLGHQIWTGGSLPIAVTVLGWVTLLKGLAILALPPGALKTAYAALHYPQRFGLVMALGALFGAALTFVAFRAS
jgi:hypothetical protein